MSVRKNQNRRRSQSQRNSGRKRGSSKEAMFDDQEFQKLHAKIGVLEDFITSSAAKQEHRSQMRARNIMPPPEQWRQSRNGPQGSAAGRRSRWGQRQENAQRDKSGLTFLLLFGAACTIGWWLLNSGI